MSETRRKQFTYSATEDADIAAWLEQQPNASAAIRQAIRAYINGRTACTFDAEAIRPILRQELSRVTLAAGEPGGAQAQEHVDADLAQSLAGMWG
jgi:hypothetical protein